MNKQLNTVWAQLCQWPPTTSTVIGMGVLIFLADYMYTGNFVWAAGIAGAFKILCPEDAATVDSVETAAKDIKK